MQDVEKSPNPSERKSLQMDTKYLIFTSVTYALRAMSLLKRHGLSSRLEKIKNISALGGCGYALAINVRVLDRAVSIITGEGIRVIDILDYK